MAWKDPIVEEVRKIREAHAAQFDYDLHRIFDDIRKHEQEHPERFAKIQPVRPRQRRASQS
jgi:hypothetical protein